MFSYFGALHIESLQFLTGSSKKEKYYYNISVIIDFYLKKKKKVIMLIGIGPVIRDGFWCSTYFPVIALAILKEWVVCSFVSACISFRFLHINY